MQKKEKWSRVEKNEDCWGKGVGWGETPQQEVSAQAGYD